MASSALQRALCNHVATIGVLFAALAGAGCGQRTAAPGASATPRTSTRPAKLDVAAIKRIAEDALAEAEALEKPFRTPAFPPREDPSEIPGNCTRWPTPAERVALAARVKAWARTAHKGETLLERALSAAPAGPSPALAAADVSRGTRHTVFEIRFGCFNERGATAAVEYVTEAAIFGTNRRGYRRRNALIQIPPPPTPAKILQSAESNAEGPEYLRYPRDVGLESPQLIESPSGRVIAVYNIPRDGDCDELMFAGAHLEEVPHTIRDFVVPLF